MLLERMQPHIDRHRPDMRKKVETSHLQSMAAFVAAEFEALSEGNSECATHRGFIKAACPWCSGLWGEGDPEDAEELAR